MNHGSQFQQLWSTLRSEVLALQQRGYYGDGAHDTCCSSVNRTFLNSSPFPTFLHPLYTPTFLISDLSGCMIPARSYLVFRNCSHCLTELDGFYYGFPLTRPIPPNEILGIYKTHLGKQDIGLQVNDFQTRLPRRHI